MMLKSILDPGVNRGLFFALTFFNRSKSDDVIFYHSFPK